MSLSTRMRTWWKSLTTVADAPPYPLTPSEWKFIMRREAYDAELVQLAEIKRERIYVKTSPAALLP